MLKRSSALVSTTLAVLPFLLLAAYLIWLLTMPAWPSQDAPVHLYYTRVLGALFSREPSPFRPYFFIKHLLPPYALYYYALLGLSHFVSLLTADRLVICGYVASFVLGFRYAARAIGPNSNVTTMLASLLVLNWALGMGFANFCLSLSFGFWAIGLWLRTGAGLELRKRLAFLALLLLITLTHPVPLLLVLGFCGLDLVCRWAAARAAWRTLAPSEIRTGAVTVALGACYMLYVKAFTVAHPLEQRTPVYGTFAQHLGRRIKDLLIVKNIEVLYGRWWEIQLYRVSLGLILVAAIVFTVQQWRKNRSARVWTNSDSATMYALCFFLFLPLLPSDISGAYYFFERLNVMLWITTLLAASGWSPHPSAAVNGPVLAPRAERETPEWLTANLGAAIFTVLMTTVLLHALDRTLRPFAERDYALAHTDLPLKGQLTMVLDGDQERKYLWAGPPWDPYYWDTVALLRHNDGIMVNAPWLDSPIIPLAETSVIPGSVLSPLLANSPLVLGYRLQDTPSLRADVLAKTDVTLFSPTGNGGRTAVPPMLGPGWVCDAPVGGGYRLCTRAVSSAMVKTYKGRRSSGEEPSPQ